MPDSRDAAARRLEEQPGGEVHENHSDSTVLLANVDRERVRRRVRLHAAIRSHQAGHKLDAWGYAMQTPERRPSDYLMSDDERRAYAQYLLDVEHWANWEVRLVLTAPGVRDRGPLGYSREAVNT